MKNRITIEIDFESGSPYIQFTREPSDDVRDKLLAEFINRIGYRSSWAKVQFMVDNSVRLYPIGEKELDAEMDLMKHRLEDQIKIAEA